MEIVEDSSRYALADISPMRQIAVLALTYQNYDQRILRGIAAYVRARSDWSLYVEEE